MMKLTVKEEEVMEKIWQLGECTPRDVLALYEEPHPHERSLFPICALNSLFILQFHKYFVPLPHISHSS